MQVPGYLSSNFKLLENLGYQMRAMDRGVRRVIKFDDDNMDLVMDVKIGDSWKRIKPAEANVAKLSRTFTSNSGPQEMSSAGIAAFFAGTPATGANTQSPMQ